MTQPLLARLLADQRERWSRGDCVLVEALLRQYPALQRDPEGLVDLIYHEVYLRERKGDIPGRDEYLRRFPHLADQISAQFDVHQAIEAGTQSEADNSPPVIPGYELLAEIGRGGMGHVYKARDETLGTAVAVKVIRAERFHKHSMRKRFVAEARAAAALDHPHIVKVLAVRECTAGAYFVMELIVGTSLEEVLQRGPVDFHQAVRWLIPVAEAVDYAHGKGIIHRDLKPANIMIDRQNRPRVLDFGMAKIMAEDGITRLSSTQEGTILGTPSYMPPEQTGISGSVPGPSNDVYSLGAILYALLTGRPPFDEGTFWGTVLKVRSSEPAPAVRALRPEVPALLEQICHRCMSKQPADRYPSALELADVLRLFGQANHQSAQVVSVSLVSITTGEKILLEKETTVVGRAMTCDLVLQKLEVSREHCRIIRQTGQVFVEDLGSLRGTYVNGTRVERAKLGNGDRLEVAGHIFQVYLC
jgi:eukaryotic-like serine/threonine-protein kinase